jgi:TolB protein
MGIFLSLFFFTFLCISMSGEGLEDTRPIVVYLSAENPLLPTYIAPLQAEESTLNSGYLESVENILRFDIGHNGMNKALPFSSAMDALCKKIKWGEAQDLSAWLDHAVYFVVQAKVQGNNIGAQVLAINSNTIKKVEGLPLTGNLQQDRRTIHKLSDLVFRALYNAPGIATTRILYTLKKQDPTTKKWVSEIFEADYDGKNLLQITRNGGYCVTPAFIPPKEGKRSGSFACVSYKIGQPKIYLGSLQKGELQRFSLLKGNQLMPVFSRQRDKVAFISDVTGNPDLFLQDFDPEKGLIGKPRQIFATHKATQGSPSFSPDGEKIAFVSNKDGSPRIYVISVPPEGTPLKQIKARLISKANRESTSPSWSPDGTKIAYSSMTGRTRQIWVYDVARETERQLTDGPGHKENPSWAPNSLHLVFNSTSENGSELYFINLNQKEAVKISSGNGEKRFPCWEITTEE